jgi:hypothetical protein
MMQYFISRANDFSRLEEPPPRRSRVPAPLHLARAAAT